MKKLAWIAALAGACGVLWLRPWRGDETRERIPVAHVSTTRVEGAATFASGEPSGSVSGASSESAKHVDASKNSPTAQVVAQVPASSSVTDESPVAKPDNTATLETIRRAAARYDASAAPELDRYLLHADPEVREAARDGMVQAGDAAAVPYLRAAAGKMKDPREAILLLDAADFLELPAALPVKKTPAR